jgi:hypothetical protein
LFALNLLSIAENFCSMMAVAVEIEAWHDGPALALAE